MPPPKKKRELGLDLAENRRGIQSVEVGLGLLRALQDAPGSLSLTAVSEAAGMPPSKAHRYLASYVRAQLVRQDQDTRRYELGPFALSLGLAALSQLDLIALGVTAARDVTRAAGAHGGNRTGLSGQPAACRYRGGRAQRTAFSAARQAAAGV